MNNLAQDTLIDSLPASIAQKLERALSSLPSGETAKIEQPKADGAFNHVLFITTETARYVFRARREMSAAELKAYMRSMYECTGFLIDGGAFKIRNIAEETEFIKRALAADLPVPQLIQAESDWMLIEYIEGKTLWSFLEAGKVEFLVKVLQAIISAHRQEIIYADRWGGNEMIDSSGKVRMIDFDIEWFYDGANLTTLKSLEIAFIIFNSMRLTSKRDELINLVESDIIPLLTKWEYDLKQIGKFIAGLANFYLSPDKPSNEWSLSTELYAAMSQPAHRLVDIFNQAN